MQIQKLDIMYNNIQIKQHAPVTYLGFILAETMSGESMVHKVICKVNARIQFRRERQFQHLKR